MSSQGKYYQPKFAREIRLGLVVYGGISLAIYIHGICQEFYHAVRGRGIYKLVKALTDADIVVDAISGSSAGGINGVLLSYALTNSTELEIIDFSSFASIWRNSGELLQVLYKPNLFRERLGGNNTRGSTDSSFNDEDFYQHQLLTELARSIEHKLPRPPEEWFSTTRELDLFIAGTDYIGRADQKYNPTAIKLPKTDHHALFHLKHRQGRKEPFNPYFRDPELPRAAIDTERALAKLCRITAGFPAIFPLVEVDLRNRQNIVDRQLVIWGNLDRNYLCDLSPDRDSKLYFLDGGLLDNAPFTCIMKETYYRLPNRISERKLFYVNPSVGASVDLPRQQKRTKLKLRNNKKYRIDRVFQAAINSIPSHQSITNDLRTIQEHNHKVIRYQAAIDRAAISVESQRLLASTDRTQSQIYLRGRLFDFRDRNLPLLLQSELNCQNSNASAIIDKIDRLISTKPTNNQDRISSQHLLDRFESQVIGLDVEYSLRQHFYLIDRINDLLSSNISLPDQQQLQHLSRQISCNIKLLEVIRTSITLLLKDRAVSNYFYYLINQESNDRRLHILVYELIFRLHRFLLDGTKLSPLTIDKSSTDKLESISADFWLNLPEIAANHSKTRWLSQKKISSVFAQLKQRIAELQQSTDLLKLIWTDRQLEYDNDHNQTFPSIIDQIDRSALALIEASNNKYTAQLLQQWQTFSCLDCELYPFEYLTNLSEKEIIHPIEISPDTAQLGVGKDKTTQEKLAGTRFYHVGGCFKKSWRSNDLIWGRLDGLNRILEGTITPESVTAFSQFIQRETQKLDCDRSEYLDWLITESLPQVSGDERQKITQHLERLAQPNLRIDRAELKAILADLVLAGQREILTSDTHRLIEDSDEQPGWWKFPTNAQTHENWIINRISFQPSSLPTPHPKDIGRIVQQSLTNLATQQKNFFQQQYRIGVDKLWENMPLVTLISVCTKIVLILRNLLIRAAGVSAPPSTHHPLYHWLDGVLQSIYWWLQGGSIRLGAIHRRPRIIMAQFVGAGMAIGGVILAILLSPFWLLFSLPGAIVCWFLQTMRLKRLTAVKTSPFLAQGKEE